MTLRDLAPVRALAAERARDVHDAAVRAIKARHFGSYAQSLIDALPPMWVDVDAHLDLLTDLTRPESRDAVARLVADWIGWEHWQIGQAIADGGDDWILLCNTVGADWTTMEMTPKDDLLGRIALTLFGREERAKVIYNGWRDQPGWVPWVEGGNSHKQDEARRLAVLA